MNEAPKKIWLSPCMEWEDVVQQSQTDIPYIRADIVDELVEELKYCLLFNGDDFMYDDTKAEAAIKKLEEE